MHDVVRSWSGRVRRYLRRWRPARAVLLWDRTRADPEGVHGDGVPLPSDRGRVLLVTTRSPSQTSTYLVLVLPVDVARQLAAALTLQANRIDPPSRPYLVKMTVRGLKALRIARRRKDREGQAK